MGKRAIYKCNVCAIDGCNDEMNGFYGHRMMHFRWDEDETREKKKRHDNNNTWMENWLNVSWCAFHFGHVHIWAIMTWLPLPLPLPLSQTQFSQSSEHDYLDTGDSQIIVHFVTISFKWSIRQIPSISWSRSFAASVLMAPVTNSSVTGFQPTIFYRA